MAQKQPRMTAKQKLVAKMSASSTMASASMRANANHTNAYAYGGGNMGDSIERRMSGFGGGGLGGGSDAYAGVFGIGTSYLPVGGGSYFGAGQSPHSRFGGVFGVGPGDAAGGFQYLRKFSSNSSFNHTVIAACVMAYLGFGVVRNVIDLYADFATEGIEIVHPDKSVRNFFKAWSKQVDLPDRMLRVFTDLFLTGNVFLHRRWAKLTEEDKKVLKRSYGNIAVIDGEIIARGKRTDRVLKVGEDQIGSYLKAYKELHTNVASSILKKDMPKNTERLIPWGYTSLNPLQMEIRGSRFRGEHYWVMALDRRDTKEIIDHFSVGNGQDIGITEINLPIEFKQRIKKYEGGGAGYIAEVKLNDDELTVLQDRKFDYWDWSVPFVYPALRALHFKDCLRGMEMRACASVINSIFLFKLGDIEKGIVPDDEAYERLADMLQMPGQAMNIIWNEAIQAEVIEPDISKIFDAKKHESADRDILTALGVPEVLIGGKGGSFSSSYISVATILERLESARNKLESWLNTEIKIISEAMGFRKLAEVKFGKTSLRDKNAERQFILGLFDRDILSADTALREIGTTAEIEVSKQVEERQISEEAGFGVFDRRGPYVRPEEQAKLGITPVGWDDEMAEKEKKDLKMAKKVAPPQSGKSPKTPNGRPPAKPDSDPRGENTNKRGPQGQGLAEVLHLYEQMSTQGREMFDSIEQRISTRALKAKGLKYVKQFGQEERDRLQGLVFNIFSHMPAAKPPDFETDDHLVHLLNNKEVTTAIKADVLAEYHKRLSDYEVRNGKQPSKEHRRLMMVSSWTTCAISNIGLYFNGD